MEEGSLFSFRVIPVFPLTWWEWQHSRCSGVICEEFFPPPSSSIYPTAIFRVQEHLFLLVNWWTVVSLTSRDMKTLFGEERWWRPHPCSRMVVPLWRRSPLSCFLWTSCPLCPKCAVHCPLYNVPFPLKENCKIKKTNKHLYFPRWLQHRSGCSTLRTEQ